MDRQDLRATLERLGISQSDLARLVDVTPRAVSLWMVGARGVPGTVAAYVQLLESLPLGMRQAELAKLTEEQRTMKDGMYLIDFAGQAGTGQATLVFEGGRIYGTDNGGGIYDGEFQLDETTDRVNLKIRVQMTAGHASVVGIVQPFDWIIDVSTVIDPDKDSDRINIQTSLGKPIVANYRFLRPLPTAA